MNANFPVTLPGNAPSNVQIAWTTTDGSATAPADYTAATGTLTIPTGQSSGTIQIKVKGDTIAEGTGTPRIEMFHVDLGQCERRPARERPARNRVDHRRRHGADRHVDHRSRAHRRQRR